MPVYGSIVEKTYAALAALTPFHAWNTFQDLLRQQYLPEDDLRQIQWRRFRNILEHAWAHVPFYRRRFDRDGLKPADIRSREDIARLPLTDRAELAAAFPDACRADTIPRRQLRLVETSGTSGAGPFRLWIDRDALNEKYALLLRNYSYAGWHFGRRMMALWNQAHEDYRPWWRRSVLKTVVYHLFHRKRWLPPLGPVGPLDEAGAQIYRRRLMRLTPFLLEGDARALYEVGLRCRPGNLRPSPVQVISSAASATSAGLRRDLEALWGAPVLNNYGPHEAEGLACECLARQGMHLSLDAYLVEWIVDGRPAGAGEMAELVITDLGNRAMPLIRYRTGDLARAGMRRCTCGRTLPVIHDVAGRQADALWTGRGWFTETDFQDLLRPLGMVYRCQLVREATDSYRVRFIDSAGGDGDVARRLREALGEQLGPEARILMEPVAMIRPEPSGKFRPLQCLGREGA